MTYTAIIAWAFLGWCGLSLIGASILCRFLHVAANRPQQPRDDQPDRLR